MARFSVHDWSAGNGLVLNLQTDFLEWLDTRVVAPLVPIDHAPPPAKQLNPVFSVGGADYVMLTQSMASVPTSTLGLEVANLSEFHDEITRAIDMMFQGF